jgi:hypothetical protein
LLDNIISGLNTPIQSRTLPRWLARSHIYTIALGGIMMLSVFPISHYYLSTYGVSGEPIDLEFALLIYGALIVMLGCIGGTIKKFLF